ncbi:hypothetical protein HW555_008785 [Spodoptera exigua]|uniref:Uncharacterized protein n=1 Tax=Spodoptera exigua TaxID=7107 RepID=A0A835GDN7_SPOEX|nr:hypothetical protein HW555_008785 [Spodoptera exigua]
MIINAPLDVVVDHSVQPLRVQVAGLLHFETGDVEGLVHCGSILHLHGKDRQSDDSQKESAWQLLYKLVKEEPNQELMGITQIIMYTLVTK